MAKITIKYVGPLKEVSLDIKRINVFMGPQSTGKSTIAKIISQALWAEKNFLIMGKNMTSTMDFWISIIWTRITLVILKLKSSMKVHGLLFK